MTKQKSIVWHIFNSSIVSGPEKAVIPNLPRLNSNDKFVSKILFLKEERSSRAEDAIEYAKSFGLEVIEVSVQKPLDWQAIKEFRSLISEHRPHLLHSHDVKAAIYTFIANILPGRLHISTFHGFARRGFKNKIYEYIFFLIANFLDQVIILNPLEIDRAKRRLIKTFHLKLIPNGVNKESSESIHCRQLTSSSKIKLVCIGRLSEEKNHEIILRAFAKLSDHIKKNFEIHLIGSGPLENQLNSMTLSLNLSKYVNFHGQLDYASLYLNQFDYYLLPSLTEGISIGLLEALHAQKKLILSDIPSIRYVIPLDKMAHFFNPRNEYELMKIFIMINGQDSKNYELAHEIIHTNFNAEAWTKNITNLYQHVVLGRTV